MLTTDKQITQPDYWNKIYEGKNDDAKVDASNTVRPVNPFDRFSWVAKHADGPLVLGVGSGHAHIEKKIKDLHPNWVMIASDQAAAAKKVANYEPYVICSAYDITCATNQKYNTIIASQCLEYMDDLPRFFNEARRVAEKILFTVPIGEMTKWSQLYVFTEDVMETFVEDYGTILHWERQSDLLLVKLEFNV